MPLASIFNGLRRSSLYLLDVFKKPEASRVKLKTADLIFFLQFIKPVIKLYVFCIAITLVLSLLRSILPLSGKLFIDFVVTRTGYTQVIQLLGPLYPELVTPGMLDLLGSLHFIVISMLLIGIAVGLLGIAQQYAIQRTGQELTLGIQTTLFNRVLRFPLTYLKNKQTGYLMSRVSADVMAVQNMMSQFVNMAFSNVFSAFFSIMLIFTLNAKLALFLSLLIPANVLVNGFFSRRIRSVSRAERENDAQITRVMQEILSGVELVKTCSTEETETKKVTTKIKTSNTMKLKNMLLSSVSMFFVGSTQSLITVLIMWIGAIEITNGAMTIGDYFAFTSYSLIITGSLNSLLNIQLSLQPMLASLERLAEMFRVALETGHKKSDKTSVKLSKVAGDVRFEGVSFSYREERKTLDEISFRVAPGEMVALVGQSGAGKTTLVNMLLKFYDPDSGAIFLDGHNLKDLDTQSLRNQVSVVSQDIFLFNDTIENNIKYGYSQASPEKVEEAAKKAHIHEHIMSLPGQYDTVIGENGSTLSLGQRQRISIARAFLKDAPILVLDEPTSSLDTMTEALIRDSLKTLAENRTVLVISHRLFVCDMATLILVLKDGKIVEAGTHQELLHNGQIYPAIYHADHLKIAVTKALAKPPLGNFSS